MTIVAHHYPFVIGADTHARSHAISILASPTGELVDEAQFPATSAGLARAIAWAGRRTGGGLAALWVIEGTGTYGARLTRAAVKAGYTVVEAARMNARANRGVGKSDPLDARRIAQAVLPLDLTELRTPRADDGARAALRVLITSRERMSGERTAAINALTALLRVTPSASTHAEPSLPSRWPRSRPGAHAGKPSPRLSRAKKQCDSRSA